MSSSCFTISRSACAAPPPPPPACPPAAACGAACAGPAPPAAPGAGRALAAAPCGALCRMRSIKLAASAAACPFIAPPAAAPAHPQSTSADLHGAGDIGFGKSQMGEETLVGRNLLVADPRQPWRLHRRSTTRLSVGCRSNQVPAQEGTYRRILGEAPGGASRP